MMKITGLSHLFKWDNLHNWWLTKYFFAPLYVSVVCSGVHRPPEGQGRNGVARAQSWVPLVPLG